MIRLTPEEVKDYQDKINKSRSYAEVLRRLHLVPAGGNYRTLHNLIRRHQLDTSTLAGQGWARGQKFSPKRPLEDYLENKHNIQSQPLRLRLLSEGVFQHVCQSCNLTEWLGQPIPLELDHVNGNHKDNSIQNLILLCPNCHAKTNTYRGKNKRKNIAKAKTLYMTLVTIDPRISLPVRVYPNKARKQSTKIQWPSDEELAKLVAVYPLYILGPKLGVSGNAVKKRCRTRDIAVPDHRRMVGHAGLEPAVSP